MLAKWPYAFFLILPIGDLLLRHVREHQGDLNAREFWRPLVTLALWAIVPIAPWYARSLGNLLDWASHSFGSEMVAVVVDPAPFSGAAVFYYARVLCDDYLTGAHWVILGAGAICLLLPGQVRRAATRGGWRPLLLSAAGGWFALFLITNKNQRYLMPVVSVAAVISAGWVPLVERRLSRVYWIAAALGIYLVIAWNLFVLAPPNPIDGKVESLAAWFIGRAQASGEEPRILVVPNDDSLNFMSLGYAINRVVPKVVVERLHRTLTAEELASYDCAVVLVPPLEETPISRHSVAATTFMIDSSGWRLRAQFERGDGRTIRVLCAP